jgi:hypothetical protein
MGYLHGLLLALALLVALRWISGSGTRHHGAPHRSRPVHGPGVWNHVETRRRCG